MEGAVKESCPDVSDMVKDSVCMHCVHVHLYIRYHTVVPDVCHLLLERHLALYLYKCNIWNTYMYVPMLVGFLRIRGF